MTSLTARSAVGLLRICDVGKTDPKPVWQILGYVFDWTEQKIKTDLYYL